MNRQFWTVQIITILAAALGLGACGPVGGFSSLAGSSDSNALGNRSPAPSPSPSPLPPPPNPAPASACTNTEMNRVQVATVSALASALSGAKPGDVIEIQPGTYRLSSHLNLLASGNEARPICLRAANTGTVFLESESSSGIAIKVTGRFWVIENLAVKGVCASDDLCEHAFQIKETSGNITIRNSSLVDFNAQIKGSSAPGASPDSVLIENNHVYDTRPRNTSNPVTKIDVVGGKHWVLRGNFIHDYEKGQGDHISYAGFLKGYSRFGIIENNVVACSLNFTGGTRIGLSFGGGTTGPQYCWDYDPATGQDCAYEHEYGIMRNNVILNCSDVGIFIRGTNRSFIANNLVIDTLGIDSLMDPGHPVPTSDISRNVAFGQIRDRNGALSTRQNNLTTTNRAIFSSWFLNMDQYDYTYSNLALFKDIASPSEQVSKDFCEATRDAKLDLGPFETQNSACFSRVRDLIKAAKK